MDGEAVLVDGNLLDVAACVCAGEREGRGERVCVFGEGTACCAAVEAVVMDVRPAFDPRLMLGDHILYYHIRHVLAEGVPLTVEAMDLCVCRV